MQERAVNQRARLGISKHRVGTHMFYVFNIKHGESADSCHVILYLLCQAVDARPGCRPFDDEDTQTYNVCKWRINMRCLAAAATDFKSIL